ncbi:unnamed protein product [Rotaria magnacalcarata]
MIHKLYEIKSPDGQSTARVLSSTALPPLKSNKRAGTYTSFDKLRADLSQQTRLCEKSFNLISNINEQLSPSNGFTLNRLIGSYTTAFSKFLDILLEKKPNENGKKLLAQKCRIYITGNTSTLNMIDEFEQTYENQNAIWWYTRDGFLFRLLNRTFRQENIQMIIYLHFFLFDLHQQLTVTYQSSNPRTGIEKYFRGQTMELEEIKKLEKNIFTHRSVTLNSFLSTTKDYGMALVYAGSGSYEKDDELQSVVFTINIARSNINSKDTEYADVEHLSYFPSEKETLFAVGSLFEIDTIEYNQNEKIWLITLFSWDEGNYETCCTVTSQLRPTTIDKKIIDAGRLLSEKTVKYNIFALFDLFAKDLIEGQFDAPVTEESFDTVKTLYYDILLETSLIDEFVYNVGVGSLAFMCERFDTAIQYLLTALTIENQNQIKDNEDALILLYDTLGHVHKEKCLYDLALQYDTESVKLVTTEQSLADLARKMISFIGSIFRIERFIHPLQIRLFSGATWSGDRSHGKGIVDGIGATIKRLFDNVIRLSSDESFKAAEDLMNKTQPSTNIRLYMYQKEDIDSVQGLIPLLITIKGTSKFHEITAKPNGEVFIKNRSDESEALIKINF